MNLLFQDFGWKAAGAALSVVCGALPFYIHYNQDRFSPPEMAFTGVVAQVAEAETRTPRFERLGASGQVTVIDSVATGTADPSGRAAGAPQQPFPGDAASLRLLSVSDNSALVVDGAVVQLVRVGSRLSSGARVDSIRATAAGGQLVTSTGEVLEAVR
ncbi:MAG: hypothetical protein CMJ42_02435 [Phyllobacteriaceae bacterium]|nr:hypothetical protein [Phyllobacteriaceae bacterium]MBA93185.1 hypothetical protein [Phyllobacteriaceae bacterium]